MIAPRIMTSKFFLFSEVVLEPLGMPAPSHLFTPPYLTAYPEVFYHQLTNHDRYLVIIINFSLKIIPFIIKILGTDGMLRNIEFLQFIS